MFKVSQKRNAEVPVGCPFGKQKDVGIQCLGSQGSYGRNNEAKVTTCNELKEKYLWCKKFTLCWLKDEALIASSRVCDVC